MRYSEKVKIRATSNGVVAFANLDSRQAVEQFRRAAKAFTAKAARSKEAAKETLVSEGIYTRSGKLTKHYR